MDGLRENTPPPVPPGAKPGGEVRARWAWAEPAVWTERMLTALETGVKGGKWFSLMDKAYAPRTLAAAFARVKANDGAPGVDRQTVKMFERRLEPNLRRLHEELRDGEYCPRAIRRVWIPKPGRRSEKRPLGIPTVRDRVVWSRERDATALRFALEPIFERDFGERSYGFRPRRGCKDALRRVDALLKQGHAWVVDADLKSYFDTIPHERLMTRVKEKVAEGRVLALLESHLRQQVLDGAARWTPEGGTPQGAIVSPLLSNSYLDPLDQLMARQGFELVRYADDFVVLCRDAPEAECALATVRRWVEAHGLILHPEKTRLVDSRQAGGFDFRGYHFERGYRGVSRKSQRKLRDAIRAKTKRANGHSMTGIIIDVNRTLRGWFAYFKHSHYTTFTHLDSWVRRRLRSILRKRHRLPGRGRGADRQRWPNAYFTDLGLFSTRAARAQASQSARR